MIHEACKPVEGERESFKANSRARLREERQFDSLMQPSLRNISATLTSEEICPRQMASARPQCERRKEHSPIRNLARARTFPSRHAGANRGLGFDWFQHQTQESRECASR